MKVSIDWLTLLPVLAPALGALLVLLVDAALPKARLLHLGVTLAALGAGIGVAGWWAAFGGTAGTLCLDSSPGTCLYVAPASASILQIAALAAAAIVVLMLLGDGRDDEISGGPAVAAALVLAATAGATGVVAAQDLGTWLVTLELATLPMIALVALAGRRTSTHGALTLLVTSVLSFALLALGVALWMIATGSPVFATSGTGLSWESDAHLTVLIAAALVLMAGLGFKLSLVPFHAWTPVTYTSAAVPVTLALATISKIAALGALIPVVQTVASVAGAYAPGASVVAVDPRAGVVVAALAGLALVSMLLGNVAALRQIDPVRLLAWSAIGQAGWVVLPLVALDPSGSDAASGYLAAYVVATTVAFVVVHLVHGPVTVGAPERARELSHTGGLARNHLWLGGLLALALLSLAGLPPGVIGLVAKVAVLQPVIAAGLWPLAVVAVLGAVLGVAVYLRWVAILLGIGRSTQPLQRMPGSRLALTLAAAVLVVTSILPSLIFR